MSKGSAIQRNVHAANTSGPTTDLLRLAPAAPRRLRTLLLLLAAAAAGGGCGDAFRAQHGNADGLEALLDGLVDWGGGGRGERGAPDGSSAGWFVLSSTKKALQCRCRAATHGQPHGTKPAPTSARAISRMPRRSREPTRASSSAREETEPQRPCTSSSRGMKASAHPCVPARPDTAHAAFSWHCLPAAANPNHQ